MTEQFFSALDTALDEEASKEARVNETLSDAQLHIGFGTKVLLLTPSIIGDPIVVGNILPPSDWPMLRNMGALRVVQSEPNRLPEPTDEAEQALYDQGWRRGMYYSRSYPIGFITKFHISRLYPLTETEFEAIRLADQDPNQLFDKPWMSDLEQNIITTAEKRPNSPYRKICPRCASGRVAIVEYAETKVYSPCALEPTPTSAALTIRTGDPIKEEVVQITKRAFKCMEKECPWESEHLDEKEYPDEHACSHHLSQLETLFRLGENVI